jgi:hypothetical protein
MTDELRLAKADLKKSAVVQPVTMQGLWRLVTWGATAVTATLIAVLASRGVVGSQRAAIAVTTLRGNAVAQVQPVQPALPATPALQPVDQADTKRLSDALAALTADDDQIKTRLSAVEHDVADITGSIAHQVQTTKVSPPAPWPGGPPKPATPAAIAAVMAPALPLPMEYGADVGSALSIQALRARWEGLRSAHPQLFSGLVPTVTLREMPQINRPELRLVVGPMVSADAATKLCSALVSYKLFCEPTIFGGQHLALD